MVIRLSRGVCKKCGRLVPRFQGHEQRLQALEKQAEEEKDMRSQKRSSLGLRQKRCRRGAVANYHWGMLPQQMIWQIAWNRWTEFKWSVLKNAWLPRRSEGTTCSFNFNLPVTNSCRWSAADARWWRNCKVQAAKVTKEKVITALAEAAPIRQLQDEISAGKYGNRRRFAGVTGAVIARAVLVQVAKCVWGKEKLYIK